jgi:hypothetical protein
MSVEVGAVTIQREHEKKLGVHPGRRDTRSSQALDSGVERFAEKHKAISPQRHRGHREA